MSSPPGTVPDRYATLSEGRVVQARGASATASGAVESLAWPVASLGALWLCCLIELLWPARAVSASFVGYLTALSLVLGLLHGALWAGVFRALKRLPARLSAGLWLSAGLSSAAWLAYQLGAFSRLHSRYAKLAIIVLCACTAAGIALGTLCALVQPTAARPRGLLPSASMRTRRSCALLLTAAFAGLLVGDHYWFPKQYPLAHAALRLAALWCAMFAIALAARSLPRVGAAGVLVAVVGYASCLILLDERRVGTLDAFDVRPWASAVLSVSRSFVDFDRDGHATLLGDTDCEPWNPRVHPGAREIPDNGIDDNCILGDATARAVNIEQVPAASEPPQLDVVLVTVDAWNPSHLGVYNPDAYGPKGRATTPALDRWAKGATVFERAYSPGGWTSVAVPSMLRGVYPRRLRWRKFYETTANALVDGDGLRKLPEGERAMHMFPMAFGDPHPTLAEMLKRRGLATTAITDDGYCAMLQRGSGIERGFDKYTAIDDLPPDQQNDAGTANLAIETLRNMPEDRRFFLWVHFFGTHYPDTRHEGIPDYGSTAIDAYDHEVRYLDTQLIRVLDAVERRKHPVALFVTADHSEGINHFTRYHGDSLDEPVIRIPMFARVPGWPAGRVPQAVSSIDLVPTILALLKAPTPRYLDGIDLGPVVTTGTGPERVLFSDTWRYDPLGHAVGDYSAAYDGARKYVLDRRTGGLYSATQAVSHATEHLVGMAPTDGLSASVYAYSVELGTLQLSE